MSNALVPAMPPPESRTASSGRPAAYADFIAHLIATAAQVPQTRARRRAEPHVALAAYRAVGQWPNDAGHALSRSL